MSEKAIRDAGACARMRRADGGVRARRLPGTLRTYRAGQAVNEPPSVAKNNDVREWADVLRRGDAPRRRSR